MHAAPSLVRSVLIPSMSVHFINLLTITRMALCPCERGRGPTMSQEITDQGPSGTECGCRGAARLVRSGFVRWQVSHPCAYLSASFTMSTHQYAFSSAALNFRGPGCP